MKIYLFAVLINFILICIYHLIRYKHDIWEWIRELKLEEFEGYWLVCSGVSLFIGFFVLVLYLAGGSPHV